MYVKNPLLLPALKDLLKDPAGKLNPLVMQNSQRLVAWSRSDRIYLQKEYHKGLPKQWENIVNQALRVSSEEVV